MTLDFLPVRVDPAGDGTLFPPNCIPIVFAVLFYDLDKIDQHPGAVAQLREALPAACLSVTDPRSMLAEWLIKNSFS